MLQFLQLIYLNFRKSTVPKLNLALDLTSQTDFEGVKPGEPGLDLDLLEVNGPGDEGRDLD